MGPFYIGILGILLWAILGTFGIGNGDIDFTSPIAFVFGVTIGAYYFLLLIQTIALSALRHRVLKWRKTRLKESRAKALAIARDICENHSKTGIVNLHYADNFLTQKKAVW
nr:hypothetical protein GCM10011355_00850 [Aquisalinus luteolus]